MRFNINKYIKVRLTDHGKEILQKYHEDLQAMYPSLHIPQIYVEDSEGYIKFQLWQFMQIFGSHFSMGTPLIIEHNEIIFSEEE